MTWLVKLGSALLIETGPCLHLHIVCSDPMNFAGYPPGSCLVVSVSTVIAKCDQTCVFSKGDHPFIDHPSFVRFKGTALMQAISLEFNVQHGIYKAQPPADQGLVKRILANLDVSDHTPGDMVDIGKLVWDNCHHKGLW